MGGVSRQAGVRGVKENQSEQCKIKDIGSELTSSMARGDWLQWKSVRAVFAEGAWHLHFIFVEICGALMAQKLTYMLLRWWMRANGGEQDKKERKREKGF